MSGCNVPYRMMWKVLTCNMSTRFNPLSKQHRFARVSHCNDDVRSVHCLLGGSEYFNRTLDTGGKPLGCLQAPAADAHLNTMQCYGSTPFKEEIQNWTNFNDSCHNIAEGSLGGLGCRYDTLLER